MTAINTEEDRQRFIEYIERSNLQQVIKEYKEMMFDRVILTKDLKHKLIGYVSCGDVRNIKRSKRMRKNRIRTIMKDLKIWII